MTFKEYAEKINKLLADNPHHADSQVVYSIDDEGNDYKAVTFNPSIIGGKVVIN